MKLCVDKYLPTRNLRMQAAEFAVRENPRNVPPGRFVHPLAMALETKKKWANGKTISCYFMEGNATQKAKVEREAHKWEKYANLKFQFVDDPYAEIRIAFRPNEGSWSYIGTDCIYVPKDENTMNFGWLYESTPDIEYQRVVLHEFGHALGAIHEHQSPAAQIPWDKEAVYKYFTGPPNNWTREDVDVNLFAKYSGTLTQFSAFDPKSIMLYSIDNDLTLGDFEIGWNDDLSDGDKQFASVSYPGASTIIVPNPAGSFDLVPNGAPFVGSLKNNQVGILNLTVGFMQGGNYTFNASRSMWMSVWNSNRKVKDGKGTLTTRLGPGQYKVRVRFASGSGVFNITCRKV